MILQLVYKTHHSRHFAHNWSTRAQYTHQHADAVDCSDVRLSFYAENQQVFTYSQTFNRGEVDGWRDEQGKTHFQTWQMLNSFKLFSGALMSKEDMKLDRFSTTRKLICFQ